MNHQDEDDFFNKKFAVEKPAISNKVSKKNPHPLNTLLDQTDPKNNATLVGILAVIAGSIGLHDFYCGNHKSGALKLVFSFFGILLPISITLSIIDCYRIGNGTYKPRRDLPLVAVPWFKKIAMVEAMFGFATMVFIFRHVVKFFMAM